MSFEMDAFTKTVASTFTDQFVNSTVSLDEAKQAAYDILDSGKFQGNIPYLKEEVAAMTSKKRIVELMYNTALSGEQKRRRGGGS